ncbi:DUF2959 domain-containing protein [Pseudoalteromonas luteoviolacea]|uniref:DNA repair ATPase n=1 Tax=Pseudoalteromonas luteoviolacea S4054 TaxID=1129367 RepID=A0A0F6AG94_9GAMM|nr:DUF2959 domain-containing protein [Pseudoalteromonas luteoviolacea]AOT09902.1 DNA repair protein [Pseudoalteromonas luteoviolacea]AOT14813.1 DNA repair protein [Pseudoalteromonas luteoviolacea]AOT19729.1 DNA repair protein [Pseudoalteromonas luteoviolacea]KKE85247.1 hypothetical protein N479_05800 [Pseudoalteromonas luteoviolacea S4054]KZN64017.1 hypothetical protein N481_03045 [Pseudoalteromonas luteoviolacea S4047-1]
MPLKYLKIYALIAACALFSGCKSAQNAYYSAWEQVGVHKRDILVDRVEDTQQSQQTSQQEFQNALERLSALIDFDGGELQSVYEQLNSDFEASQKAAQSVTDNIDKVESVADALFEEWQTELEEFSNPKLKRSSEQKLQQTQKQYDKLLRSMRKSESKMQPVLDSMKDNVLYLKHNLNAQAIAAIRGEFTNLKRDIQGLITDMNRSIADSTAFIEQMNKN